MKKYLLLFLAIGILVSGCKKNDDPDPNPIPTADLTVQDFMWKSMNLWYFWQADVPDLADDRFATDKAYTDFLKGGVDDPENFFYSICNKHKNIVGDTDAIDRFSFLDEDYKTLVQSFAGISKSNGLEFGLIRFSGSDDVFGYVRYIVAGSDAATKDIKRGDIFIGVNGQNLNLNNYVDLLFGDSDTYTLNMADISNGTITSNGKQVSLTQQEGLTEDPVFIAETKDIGGHKIGYLMYNGFVSNFDEELNTAFGQFKADGVTDLVLDLRYNPGGSVNSSRLLASMIYGTNSNDLYIRQRWNDKIQNELSTAQLDDYFGDKTSAGTAINTLNLSKVYVLATGSSASASELVMNGLAPYMDVVHIGTTTTGKNEFSITLVDNPSNSFIYDPDKEGQINKDDSWGLQPLVGRNENADGFSDYTSGLVPDIELKEDLENLGILGDPSEPLFARAIQEITGMGAKRDFTVQMPVNLMTSSKMFTPVKDNMYLDKITHLDFK